VVFEKVGGCKKRQLSRCKKRVVKYWEIIADRLSKAGWSWDCISSSDHQGRQFWVVAAEREDGGRFIVHADEKLTAFLELEAGLNSVEHIASTHEVAQDGLSTRARV
jgi:hypothetical protein